MIKHSTGILESTTCSTYGMMSCLTPQTSNSNRPFHITGPTTYDQHYKLSKTAQGTHALWKHTITVDGIQSYIINLVWHKLVPGVTHHTINGAVCGIHKYS